jgi:hypothetical protein
MTVTPDYIDPLTRILKSVSVTSRFPETHTLLHISSALRDVIKSWGIEKKVTSIVTDVSNMVAARPVIKNGGMAKKYIPCLAHTEYNCKTRR